MTNAEIQQEKEIARVKKAIKESKSEYLKKDYRKYLKTLINELREYRQLRYGKQVRGI